MFDVTFFTMFLTCMHFRVEEKTFANLRDAMAISNATEEVIVSRQAQYAKCVNTFLMGRKH